MATCAMCGKAVSNGEMQKDVVGGVFGDLLGTNAKYMPNALQELAMKCERCGAWICNRCAVSNALQSGAGMLKHASCGGMFANQ
jgi:hypothetical protein